MGIQIFAKVLTIIVLLRCCLICSAHPGHDDDPIITTASGKVIGEVERGEGDIYLYLRFTGIPYGKIEKRFEASKPADKWEGVKDATQPGPICYQKTFHTQDIVGVEDCLNLNVYTATLPSVRTPPRPVMVFIHGGSFFSGSGIMYKPTPLMIERNIVIVTVNYRLGAFGFLDMGIKEAPGNQGAKDVVLALKWVRDNIAKFNGDPNEVTIFGESAGGAMVSQLIYSPMSQGLFQRAIAQSGTGVAPFSVNARPKYYATRIATKLNCTTELNPNSKSSKEILSCLQRQDKLDILNTLSPLDNDWDNEADCAEMQFNFSVEKEIEGEEAFLPETPTQLIKKGNFQKIPVMIGINALEAYYWAHATLANKKKVSELNNEWNRVSPILFKYYSYGDKSSRDELSRKIREFYFQNAEIKNDAATLKILEKAFGDRLFRYPARYLAELLAEQDLPVYLYSFDKKMDGKAIGPVHAEELNYLFNIPAPDGVDPPIISSSPDYEFAKHFSKLWISFAYDGKPNHFWGKGSAWKRFSPNSNNIEWCHINDNILKDRAESERFRERMEFWKSAEKEDYANKNKNDDPQLRNEL